MRYTKCKCGCENFEIKFGKIECKNCGKWANPFSAIYRKLVKPNGRHYFWVVLTPHFIERLEERLPEVDIEDFIQECYAIEKACTIDKSQGTKYNGKHIYWKFKFNHRRKRLELEMISLTPDHIFQCKYHPKVEFVEVNFNE